MDLDAVLGEFEVGLQRERDKQAQIHKAEQYRLAHKQIQESQELEGRFQVERESLIISFLTYSAFELRELAEVYGLAVKDPSNIKDYLASFPTGESISQQIGKKRSVIVGLEGKISDANRAIERLDLESHKEDARREIFRKKHERQGYKRDTGALEKEVDGLEAQREEVRIIDRLRAALDNNYYLPIIVAENKREQFAGQQEFTILLPFLQKDLGNPQFPSKLIKSIYQSVYDGCASLQDGRVDTLYTRRDIPFVNVSFLLGQPFESVIHDLEARLTNLPYKNTDMFAANIAVDPVRVEKFYSQIPLALPDSTYEKVKSVGIVQRKELSRRELDELNSKGLLTENQAISILYNIGVDDPAAIRKTRHEFQRSLTPKIEGAVSATYEGLELTVAEYGTIKVFKKDEVEKVRREQTIVLADGTRKFFTDRILTLDQVCLEFDLKAPYVKSMLTRERLTSFDIEDTTYIPVTEAMNLRDLGFR